ncbi:MAG: hypothetical protein IPM24_21110 [Bryobacterales bacterium]|nr:hypothetical protein [Bryobacterales bacterium]
MRLLLCAALFSALPAQPASFLTETFGTPADQPLLGPDAPGFTLTVANRSFNVDRAARRLTLDGIPLRFDLRHERRGGIDLYRIRHAKDSEIRGEQIRFAWSFPPAFNESMTLDTGAMQGQPLYLPNGKVPDNQFTNWGLLFYNRAANLAVGAVLDGAEAARNARRGHSRFTGITTLQLTATTASPRLEITLFAYRPGDREFWWAEWYQFRSGSDPEVAPNFFPILAPADLSWQPGERQTVRIVPSPGAAGRKMELVGIDEVRRQVIWRVPFTQELPVTAVKVEVGEWRSGLYRLIVVPAGQAVDPAAIDLNAKLTNVFVRPTRPGGTVLFVVPTDMWYAYSTNGGHDFHGWRTGYDGSVGYSPAAMSSRHRRLNHFYYSLYERYNDIHHFRYLEELALRDGFAIDYATQHDVALGRVRLDDYRLVLIGNHCEFTTREGYLRFTEYLGRGGAVLVHGGDSFAVMVEYLPSLEAPRYIWQQGHLWAHLSDQPSDFRAPVLLPADAPPDASVVNPDPGSGIDYLNPFHNTVGYWPAGSKAVIAAETHPIVAGLNLKRGDEVPGPWGGEVDIPYAPHAWDVIVRSERAAPEGREFGIDAYDPTPFHRVGLAVHKNLRLGMVCGENFPNVLAAPESRLFRELYRRTVRHLLDGPGAAGPNLVPESQRNGVTVAWDQPVTLTALRYELPAAIDLSEPDWYRKPAPYANYTIETSIDGETWELAADRRYGPWRGVQTDTFAPRTARFLRFAGRLSTSEPLTVRHIEAYGRD